MNYLLRASLVFALASFVSGCGGTRATPTAPSPAPASASNLTINGFRTLAAKGETGRLTAMVTYSDGSIQDESELARWSVANPAVATVSSTGIVTALTDGHTTVTATFGALSGTKNILVDLS